MGGPHTHLSSFSRPSLVLLIPISTGGSYLYWFLSMSKNSFRVSWKGSRWPVRSPFRMQKYDHRIAVYEFFRKKMKKIYERCALQRCSSEIGNQKVKSKVLYLYIYI